MIVYSSTKEVFQNDILSNDIENKILSSFERELGHSTSKNEVASWKNSMMYMNNVLADPEIPNNAGVAIEYKIPQTSNRIDFILTGVNKEEAKTAVLIELKQWSEAEATDKDGVVKTFVGGGIREFGHPSYQVWSYALLLESFNETIEDDDISLIPCAYLHNFEPDDSILSDFYEEYLEKAPLFLKPDAVKLREFIKQFVKKGDQNQLMYRIDNGKIRPSKNLADTLSSMLKGNQEFVMIDDQKIVYENARKLATESTVKDKNVIIVEGGPGTGKSVVSVNLLVALTSEQLVAQYVTRNAAPREVYMAKLTGALTKNHISNLFRGSGSFHSVEPNAFDALIVDEAHRLNEKSGLYGNQGENQIKELIEASKFSVFFIDEDQRVTLKDIGEKEEIRRWAEKAGAKVQEMELTSQFRCNGSDGYLAWVDNALQIRETANQTLEGIDYDFQVFDNPQELHDTIKEKNKENNKSRVVAGYCWKWISKKNPELRDIAIGDYQATWNLDKHGQSWLIQPDSVSEVGCIHTCQGLELDYVGVIIGPDLVVRDGEIITYPEERASTDRSVFGWKKFMREEPDHAKAQLEMIIKNTYRTLMTRGMKGCYLYCTDKETSEYFKSMQFCAQSDT